MDGPSTPEVSIAMGNTPNEQFDTRPRAVTTIARHDEAGVTVRGYDLVNDLVGNLSYTRMFHLLLCKRLPSDAEARVLDACLVILMEAGLNASSVVTRVTASARPGQTQTAIAAGLLTVGERFAGSSQACGDILVAAPADPEARGEYCRRTVEAFRTQGLPVPGLGHGTHKDNDPRAQRLIRVATDEGVAQQELETLRCLGDTASSVLGRTLVVNVTGAISALLLGIGIPAKALTAVAVVSRCGGLAAHAVEESETRTSDALWQVFRDTVPYDDSRPRPPAS